LSLITVIEQWSSCELRLRLFASLPVRERWSEMDTLPTTKRGGGGRSKPVPASKSSLVMAFFSCVAWLYVAGRYVRAHAVHSLILLCFFRIVSPNRVWIHRINLILSLSYALMCDSQRNYALQFKLNGFAPCFWFFFYRFYKLKILLIWIK